MKVLVTAASKHGATAEIAAAIGEGLRNRGHQVAVVAPELGLRAGDCLRSRPVWLFSSGPVGDPSRKLVQKMTADPGRPASSASPPRSHPPRTPPPSCPSCSAAAIARG